MTKTILIVAAMSLSIICAGQTTVRLPEGNITYEQIIDAIDGQLHLGVAYDKGLVNKNWRISSSGGIIVLDTLLKRMFVSRGLAYKIKQKTIWVTVAPTRSTADEWIVRLFVTGLNGEYLPGATACVRGTRHCEETDAAGMVVLHIPGMPVMIEISHTGYDSQWLEVRGSGTKTVSLISNSLLTEANVNGYVAGSRKHNSGDIIYRDSVQKEEQSTSTLCSFLTGRVSGVLFTQTSGIPGAASDISIRGRGSILNGRDPLLIIDGVPFPAGNQSVSNIPTGNAAGSLSPLSFLTMNDIEKIAVLKDADATAIYGSRGANGVIVITTRRWAPGHPHLIIDHGDGFSWVTRRPALMNTKQYLSMRTDAFRNDGITPDTNNFPELLVWGPSRDVDYGKWAIGGTGKVTHTNIAFAGGADKMHYFLGGNYLKETNVFPTHPAHTLWTTNGNFGFRTSDRKLEGEISGLWGRDENHQFISDLTQVQFLAPNTPALTDQQNRILFQLAGVPVINPWYFIGNSYKAISSNLLVSGNVKWRLQRALQLRLNGGWSKLRTNELAQMPIWNQNPVYNPTGSSYEAATQYRGWIFEPQLEYVLRRGEWCVSFLGGSSWQGSRNGVSTVSAMGFSSDSLLSQLHNAANIVRDSAYADYLYKAYFSRVNVNWKNTYILNITGRRDGSNRFAKSTVYGNFGAVGAAWVFSEENFLKKALPILSLGKLRASYGITGNDQIGGGNRYLESWAPTSAISYQNAPGVYSTGPVRPDLSWEIQKKLEVAMEWGLKKDQYLFGVSWYRHRSSNQLLPDSFPSAGGPIQLRNRPVILQNMGWEFNFEARIIHTPKFSWSMSANVSCPTSKLVAFDSIDATPFGNDLTVGRSLSALRGYRYIGVSPLNGTYQFEDRNNDGKINNADREFVGKLDVTCFGGWENVFCWKNWRLETMVEGRKQLGTSYQAAIFAANPPGSTVSGFYSNQPADLDKRWRKPGDAVPYQMASTKGFTEAGKALSRYLGSTGILTDASFIRLKVATLSYQLPAEALKKMHLQGMKLSLQALNLFTLTPYQDGDPEIQRAVTLPPMRSVIFSVQLKF